MNPTLELGQCVQSQANCWYDDESDAQHCYHLKKMWDKKQTKIYKRKYVQITKDDLTKRFDIMVSERT